MTLQASSTLIIDGSRHIVVDTGSFSNVAELDTALRMVVDFGVDGITDHYFTHLHFDHYKPLLQQSVPYQIHFSSTEYAFVGELMLFKDDIERYRAFLLSTHEVIAPVFLRQFVHMMHDRRYQFAELGLDITLHGAGEQLSPHVETLNLAGHCPGQLGLRVDTAQGVCIVAGDAALSLSDFLAPDTSHHLIVFNRADLLLSRQRIAAADVVIPGHGEWFDPKRGKVLELSEASI